MPFEEASIRALNAGCDLLILGGKLLIGEHAGFELTTANVLKVHVAIIEAVKNGLIPEEKINKAVMRILKLKNQYLNLKYIIDNKGTICATF